MTDYELNKAVREEVFTLSPNRNFVGNIANAWYVVERLRELGLEGTISSPARGCQDWYVRGWNPETNLNFIAHDPHVCRAICKAALEAVRQINRGEHTSCFR